MPLVENLLSKSIPELRELFLERRRPVPKGLLEALEIDTRQGAHHLAKQIRVRYRSNRSEGQRLHTLLRFEIVDTGVRNMEAIELGKRGQLSD